MPFRMSDLRKYTKCRILSLFVTFFIASLPLFSQNIAYSRFDSISQAIDRITFSHGKQAKLLIEELFKIADHYPDSLSLSVQCIYQKSAWVSAQGSYDSLLIEKIQKKLEQVEPSKYPAEDALLHYSLSLNYVVQGNYAEAFMAALHTLERFKQLNDSLFIAKTFVVLGRICNYIKSYQLGEDYYNEALLFANPSQIEYYHIRSNIFNTWARLDQIDASIDSFRYFIPVVETLKDTGLLASTYLNIGANYAMKKDYHQAFFYYDTAKIMSKFVDNERLAVFLYQNLGIYYINIGNLSMAYQNFLIAHGLAQSAENPGLMGISLSALSYIHEKWGDLDSAFFYLKEYNTVRDIIVNQSNPIEAYQAYVSVFLEASQKELTIKEQEILLKNRRFVVTLISAIGIILLIASWLIILYQQKRHIRQQTLLKEAENRDLEVRLKHEKRLQQIQKEQIEAQVREITSYSLLLSNKNQILSQISEVTKQHSRNQEEFEDHNRKINRIIKNNLHTDKDWNDFMLHFDKVHPHFFDRLKSACDNLTENNLRMCAYFRIGMSAKQIAQILNIEPNSIKIHRYRLKKKFNLPEERNLDDFLRNV